MISLWDVLYTASLPVVAPVIAYKRIRHGKYRDSLPAMLGRRLPVAGPEDKAFRMWLHSVSVGETVAAGALYADFRRHNITWKFLSTTTTETGQAQALKSLGTAEAHAYAPADFTPIVRRFINAYRPSALVLLETELWPNMLVQCRRAGIPAFLANGKLSANSAARYTTFSPMFRPALKSIRLFLMQTQEYAERMARVMGTDHGIHVTGNIKFDALPKRLSQRERSVMRQAWRVEDDELVLIAGSTHHGEEILIAEAFRSLLAKGHKVRLLVAPRHPERFNEVGSILRNMFPEVHNLSTDEAQEGKPVLFLDKMHYLSRTYGAADIALVGGSWVNVGGHNLLEASTHGLPVLHGPHMQNQGEILRLLHSAGGCVRTTEQSLERELELLVTNHDRRKEMGEKGEEAAESNRGAAARTVDLIEQWLIENNYKH